VILLSNGIRDARNTLIRSAMADLLQQTCINNMLALAPSLGCSSTDAACLCKNVNFGYGIRDCSNAACGTAIASTVIAFGNQYCSCEQRANICNIIES
jgi:hypothetical protein